MRKEEADDVCRPAPADPRCIIRLGLAERLNPRQCNRIRLPPKHRRADRAACA